MKRRSTVPLRVAAVSAAAGLVVAVAATPALAAEGDVEVVNTETVSIYTDATGKVEKKRIYEQIAATGNGTVDLRNPAQTDGMRNLDGFGGFDTEGDEQVVKLEVDGDERLRTVSEYPGDLPLDVSVRYYLDGEAVEPGDVVGESGRLEVKYTVKNVTATPQELTFDDGKGGTATKTVDVPIPMVGSLTTVAPPNFTDVESGEANMAGDGKGGTKLSFTMTLFPPIGSDTAEFGYSATITDGLIPRAAITALPVNPLESPSFKSAGESYQGGADTGIELAAGASEIDSNLLKLRDGAGELLAGLIKLRNGAVQLEAGLSGVAAPGANRLSQGAAELAGGIGQLDDGAGRLSTGAGQLSDGAGQLAGGADQLADGTGRLDEGADKLAAGAGELSGGLNTLDNKVGDLDMGAARLAAGQAGLEAGLTQLYEAVESLPASVREELKSNVDYQTLLGALQAIADGVGTRADSPTSGTLLGGVNAIEYAMRFPGPNDCAAALSGATPTNCGAMDAVQLVSEQLDSGATDLNQLKPVLQFLYTHPTAGVVGGPCPAGPLDGFAVPPATPTNACEMVATLYYGLFGSDPFPAGAQAKVLVAAGALEDVYQGVDSDLLAAGAGLDRLRAGLSNGNPATCAEAKSTPSPADDCGIREAALAVEAGIPMLVDELTTSISNEILAGLGRPTKGCDPEETLRCAAAALADGGEDLVSGVNALVAGVQQLNAGGMDLMAGAGQLAAGTGELDAGANQLTDGANKLASGSGELADGAGELADGTGRAADGANQVADGANQLASGLGDAADGSGQLADGLKTAAKGAPKLENGAQRLSDEGTSKLVEAGEATAQNYGEMYATIEAGAERAQTEKMVYGAPEGAMGLAAFSYEIGGEDGEGGRNVARALGGAAILAAGAGAFALRRRFI